MKQTTKLALDSHTIEFFSTEPRRRPPVELFVINFFKTELEALQKEDADVAPQLRTINDYLGTVFHRELQALETG